MSTDSNASPESATATTTTVDSASPAVDPSLIEKILTQMRTPKSHAAVVEQSIHELVDYVAKFDPELKRDDDVEKFLDAQINELDRLLSDQVNAIMHDPMFKKLESSWRGLHYFVDQSLTSPSLKIRVLDVSKKELHRDLEKASEYTESMLYKTFYTRAINTPGAEPYAAMIGDFEFDISDSNEVDLLERVTKVGAAAHAPFLTAANPGAFGFESFEQMPDVRSLAEIFDHKRNPSYTKWAMFRESEDSRYAGLCLPHMLIRKPYGTKKGCTPVDNFRFEEEVSGTDHTKYLWGNAAYALASRLSMSCFLFGSCQLVRGLENGGKVQGLPLHEFNTERGSVDSKCPTEVSIDESREQELANLGFIPLSHYKHTDYAVFFSVQSAQKPKKFLGPKGAQAESSSRLSTNLPYVLMVSRFAQYLKVMMRDKIGAFMSRSQCEAFLQEWINNYVVNNDEASSEMKARMPLKEARITVEEDPRRPGCYRAVSYLRPHFMFESLTAEMRLVSELPDQRGS